MKSLGILVKALIYLRATSAFHATVVEPERTFVSLLMEFIYTGYDNRGVFHICSIGLCNVLICCGRKQRPTVRKCMISFLLEPILHEWGSGGRWFKSSRPDQLIPKESACNARTASR